MYCFHYNAQTAMNIQFIQTMVIKAKWEMHFNKSKYMIAQYKRYDIFKYIS